MNRDALAQLDHSNRAKDNAAKRPGLPRASGTKAAGPLPPRNPTGVAGQQQRKYSAQKYEVIDNIGADVDPISASL